MSRPVIVCDRLGKLYHLGSSLKGPRSLREAISRGLQAARALVGDRRDEPKEDHPFWALKDVSFDVARGEVVGLIGKNGAGKSTLLKVLSRIVEPTTGTARLRGRIASLLEVGTGFHPELTGRENIYMNGAILGMRKAEIDRKFDEIVAFSEVEEFLDTPVKRYSSGMYVRLAFAVAAHLEPEVLIVDEVLAVGDAAFQKKCLGKMQDIAAGDGRTILFVSHSMASIRSLCSRVIWLKAGRVVWDGAVGPAIESYLTEDLGGTSNIFDVARLDRHYAKEPAVRLLRVALNDGGPVRHGEPLEIDIDYRAERRTEGVAFALSLSSSEGSRIVVAQSDIPGGRLLHLEPGSTGRVRLSIAECQLQPARYYINAGARSGENVSLDYVSSFAQVEVVPGSKTPAVIVGRNEAGCVRTPVELTILDSHAEQPAHFAQGTFT